MIIFIMWLFCFRRRSYQSYAQSSEKFASVLLVVTVLCLSVRCERACADATLLMLLWKGYAPKEEKLIR